MKSSSKISLHPLTLTIWFAGLITGYAKYIFAIFMIVFIHELGHVTLAKCFKREVVAIKILPFGGLTEIDGKISENIYEDLLISSGGIAFQLLLGLAFITFHRMNLLGDAMYGFLRSYNAFIITFNLLPICPLDGYKMIKLLIELWMPYKLAYVLGILFSFSFLAIFVSYRWDLCRDNILVVLFLIFMLASEIRIHKYACLKFYLERMNYDFYYASKNVPKKEAMFKNKVNYIAGLHEKEYLKTHFTPKID